MAALLRGEERPLFVFYLTSLAKITEAILKLKVSKNYTFLTL